MGETQMKEAGLNRMVIAAPEAVAARLAGILANAQLTPEGIFHSGEEALAAAQGGGLLLTTYRLPDMTGEELASRLGEAAQVLMIVPQDYSADAPGNVITLHNPISQDALVQTVRVLLHCCARMEALRAQVEKLTRTLEERKLVDRAKGRLMDTMHLSEAEAHYFIQKKSMDSGRRIADVAREILEAAQAAAN